MLHVLWEIFEALELMLQDPIIVELHTQSKVFRMPGRKVLLTPRSEREVNPTDSTLHLACHRGKSPLLSYFWTIRHQ